MKDEGLITFEFEFLRVCTILSLILYLLANVVSGLASYFIPNSFFTAGMASNAVSEIYTITAESKI